MAPARGGWHSDSCRLGDAHKQGEAAGGQFREAADCYRKVIEFMRASPEDPDTRLVDIFLNRVVQLEALAAEAQRAVSDVDRSD